MKQITCQAPTILIIDRDEEDCIFFEEAIKEVSPGIEVVFWNGKDPLFALIEKVQPSMIFVEFDLPGENGIDIVQQLKSHTVFHSIPVIMWSTGNLGIIVRNAYKAGVQLYLEKPWKLTAWVKKIRLVIQQFTQKESASGQPAWSLLSTVLRKVGFQRQTDPALSAQTA